VGGLLAVYDTSTINSQPSTHFTCFDGNGNVMALVNAVGGTLTAQYEFGPFGEVLRATGPMAAANPFRFSTKFQDDETGLLYYGYRYYDPSTGRWNSRDPLGNSGQFLVREYVAVLNDPVSHADKLGLLEFESNSCQGCNGARTDSSPNTCKDDAAGKWTKGGSGKFSTSCFGNKGTMCNTETHVLIRARERNCPKTYTMTCTFEYEGTVVGDEKALILLRWHFLFSPGQKLDMKFKPGGTATVSLKQTYSLTATFTKDVWVPIAKLVPADGSDDSTATGSIKETGSVSCSATPASGVRKCG
jgi:RHS repeat-associated protein